MNRFAKTFIVLTTLVILHDGALKTATAQYSSRPCYSEQVSLAFAQRQAQAGQNRVNQLQNSLVNLQNRIDTRTLSYQLQVDQALAWKQSAAGLATGSVVGCAIRNIFGRSGFRYSGGRCFASSAARIIQIRASADARYNLALNRLTTFQNTSAMQLSRAQNRLATAQLQSDDLNQKLATAQSSYTTCQANQSKSGS